MFVKTASQRLNYAGRRFHDQMLKSLTALSFQFLKEKKSETG